MFINSVLPGEQSTEPEEAFEAPVFLQENPEGASGETGNPKETSEEKHQGQHLLKLVKVNFKCTIYLVFNTLPARDMYSVTKSSVFLLMYKC